MRTDKGRIYPLGALVLENGVNFSVAVEQGKKCELLLYKAGGKSPFWNIEMKEEPNHGMLRAIQVEGLKPEEWEYNFRIDGAECLDPYVRAVSGKKNWGEPLEEGKVPRGRIVVDDYDWEGDTPLQIPYEEVVAYSLHVRGFTKHSSSKVKNKGTFSGVVEKIPYMRHLGINQIHLMPIYEFEENGKYKNYWGYGEAYWFAPKAAYAKSHDQVKELRDMVKSCHRSGIEVILNLPFTAEVSHSNIVECIHYYMLEFHVDGFIVNPCCTPFEELRKDPLLSNTKILRQKDDFQDIMRRFLKGDEGMIDGVMWWLRHTTGKDGVFNYITSHTGFTLNDLVSYDRKHNELNGEKNQDGPDYNYSWNCGAEGPSRKKAVVELRKNQIKNACMLLLFAQGMPCIHAGDEFLNSQKGNNNVYCQDNETGWLNWSKEGEEYWLFRFVRDLIAFRRKHPVLHCKEELAGIDRVASGVPDISYHGESAWQVPSEVSSRQLGIYYYGEAFEDVSCFVAYNMHWLAHSFALPALTKKKKWYLAVSTQDGVLEEEILLENQKEVIVDERTICIFIGR